MMGKTHIAGSLATWALVYPLAAKTGLSTPRSALVLAASLGGTVIAGLLPDIDQPGSTIDRTLFGPLGKTRARAMLAGLLLLGISLLLRSPALIAHVFYLPISKDLIHYVHGISLIIGALGACLVTISTLKHRGITHTLLGMALFLWAADTILGFIPILVSFRIELLIVYGAGYLSHLLLDLIAHGDPLFYPVIKKRIHLPFSIRTGSFGDIVVIRFVLLAYFAFVAVSLYVPAAWLVKLHI